jgi:homogentisate 1,2-dioxygenase
MNLEYLSGFGNEFASEALPGALPVGQNSPQKPLWPVRRTALRHGVHHGPQRSPATWLYRIQPSANHPAFVKLDGNWPAARWVP